MSKYVTERNNLINRQLLMTLLITLMYSKCGNSVVLHIGGKYLLIIQSLDYPDLEPVSGEVRIIEVVL